MGGTGGEGVETCEVLSPYYFNQGGDTAKPVSKFAITSKFIRNSIRVNYISANSSSTELYTFHHLIHSKRGITYQLNVAESILYEVTFSDQKCPPRTLLPVLTRKGVCLRAKSTAQRTKNYASPILIQTTSWNQPSRSLAIRQRGCPPGRTSSLLASLPCSWCPLRRGWAQSNPQQHKPNQAVEAYCHEH